VELHDDNALIIYSDVSCLSKPRRGGYAFRLVTEDANGEELTFDYNPPGRLGATNNEMELTAVVEALRTMTGSMSPVLPGSYEKIVVYADSLYVVDNVYSAAFVWPKSGWITRENEPVLNQDLWRELIRLKKRAGRIEFRHVKAHKAKPNPHNDHVDKLAKQSAELADRTRPARMVGRKTGSRKTEPRVVPMEGQTETIRITVVRAISARHHGYKYEIVGEDSPSLGAVDDAFARNEVAAMRRAHVYEVRFSESGKGRWIEEVIREIARE
jgi:ribonuclease HI